MNTNRLPEANPELTDAAREGSDITSPGKHMYTLSTTISTHLTVPFTHDDVRQQLMAQAEARIDEYVEQNVHLTPQKE